MKKLLASLLLTTSVMSSIAYADQVPTQVPLNNGQVTVESPRTGIQYVVPNPNQRPVVIQTQGIDPANSVTADRIVASNPALSVESQELAKKALIELSNKK